MSLDSWIIDELEREERRREERDPSALELELPVGDGRVRREELQDAPSRGVTTVDISPLAPNVILI